MLVSRKEELYGEEEDCRSLSSLSFIPTVFDPPVSRSFLTGFGPVARMDAVYAEEKARIEREAPKKGNAPSELHRLVCLTSVLTVILAVYWSTLAPSIAGGDRFVQHPQRFSMTSLSTAFHSIVCTEYAAGSL